MSQAQWDRSTLGGGLRAGRRRLLAGAAAGIAIGLVGGAAITRAVASPEQAVSCRTAPMAGPASQPSSSATSS